MGSILASRCLRKASSWARAFCLRLIFAPEVLLLALLPRVSEELFPLALRRKLKLVLRVPDWLSTDESEGRAAVSGESSLCAEGLEELRAAVSVVEAMVGGGGGVS